MKKLIALFGLALALLAPAAQATNLPSQCTVIDSSSDFFAQVSGGHLSMTGQICISFVTSPVPAPTLLTWDGTLTFSNFAPPNAPGFTANGSLTFGLNYNYTDGIYRVSYNGPLVYNYAGTTYNVVFNNLVFVLNISPTGEITAASTTGSVTINGQVVQGDSSLFAYLF